MLVAFDGPIAALPSTRSPADGLRVMVAEGRLPREVARTDDPFVILAYAATIGPATERAVYAQLCRIEHGIVAVARVAPGIREALAATAAAGTRITVVSSLDLAAVRAFLVLHGLEDRVHHLAARTGPDRTVLPPAPDLVTLAIHTCAIPVESCVFVGATDHDLTAARAAGVETIHHRRVTFTPAPQSAAPRNPWFDALSAPTKR
ncbi:beta-phosphoglucomutase-like phosphatase (HAD superfamily) [Saccharothrix tamanrassetensis]|uniref:Beta-phosphoglucomutase-like phosphatase (HAD superfamily) n=1 Tax=Saccharothrix tamanrassetensis TaxID=1051531 RepID=A0A841CB20_9PSEU|nr:HAD hydrolase-like protein [Saccharothrix tamanrassetensis]MBB5954180.1 beta-phosphoglucomutase-like phosphatase (HAD superfamily) [Saccharothrix tamanrassetensis]